MKQKLFISLVAVALIITGCGGGSSVATPQTKSAAGVRAQGQAFYAALEKKAFTTACNLTNLPEKTSLKTCEMAFQKVAEKESLVLPREKAAAIKWNITINGNKAAWETNTTGTKEHIEAEYKNGRWILLIPATTVEALKAIELTSQNGETRQSPSEEEAAAEKATAEKEEEVTGEKATSDPNKKESTSGYAKPVTYS